jgi:hypothetical protein
MHEVPERARAVADRLMAEIDARMPGQLEGFYLVGSLAQGDYREGRSDFDFVAVLAGQREIAALDGIHADIARAFPGLHCDGIYVRAKELSAPADGAGIRAHEGTVEPHSTEGRHPVTWLHLADDGIALRGRKPDATWIAADRTAARLYSRKNLSTYWRQWLARCRQPASAKSKAPLTDRSVTWGALGVARVHATIADGRVPSKTQAGAYALDTFPRHHRIITEALRLRIQPHATSPYDSRLARQQELFTFMDEVIASGSGW